jgi:hypothetical protein
MRIMFDAISITNETSFVPSTNGGECEGAGVVGGVDNNEGQEEEQPPIIPNDRPLLQKGQPPVLRRERRRRLLEISV